MDVDSPNSLKRCSSAPQINNLLPSMAVHHSHNNPIVPMDEGQPQTEENTAAIEAGTAAQAKPGPLLQLNQQQQLQQQNLSTPQLNSMSSSSASSLQTAPHRDSPPTSFSNIFAPRVRRFSASFSPLAVISNGSSSPNRSGSCTPGPRLTPRISQLRQEECADLSNSREVNHEREIHSAMQMSQSYEDLTLVTENWSFSSATNTKHNDDLINPLHVALPSIGTNYCSSPSPTSRAGLGLQYPTTSPSPTRKYVTRRSMSPCPIRPSPLSSVKRKFDLEDGNNYGNCYSPPPLKKIFTSTDRGTSPVCQTPSPSPICPSPDSSTASFENGSNNASSGSGRITPKFFVTRLSSSGGGQLFSGNGGGGGGPPPHAVLNPQQSQVGATTAPGGSVVPVGTLHTDSPPSSSSSSSLMMMDCGVSSSSGGGLEPKLMTPAATVSSSGVEGKIDCDEDITDLNVIASSTSMATTESSEAAMEEVIKTTRALDESELQLLDSSSSVVSNCHRLSSGSVGNISSNENNNSTDGSNPSSSLCPLTFGAGSTSGTNGASATTFMVSNIEIAET